MKAKAICFKVILFVAVVLFVAAPLYAQPTVTVTSPGGGEHWAGGSQHNITWSTSGEASPAAISIYFSNDGGLTYPYIISTGEADDGTYSWTIPTIATYEVETAKIVIEAQDINGVGTGECLIVFTIDSTPPNVGVVAPNALSSWEGETLQTIEYYATDYTFSLTQEPISLYYSTNGGSSYTTIEVDVANDGTYTWPVPNVATTTEAKVKVVARDEAGNVGSAESANFTLQQVPPDTTPPDITSLQFDGRRPVSGDIISPTPNITANIADRRFPGDAAAANRIASIDILVDGTPYYQGTYGGWSGAFDDATGAFNYTLIPAISEGTHTITFRATDISTNANVSQEAIANLSVLSGLSRVVDPPLNYPNPFSPVNDGGTWISYKLSSDAVVTIYIYDVRAGLLWRGDYPSGTSGGQVGYNEVFWNGKNTFGEVVANGMYTYKVIIGGRVVAEGRLVVLE